MQLHSKKIAYAAVGFGLLFTGSTSASVQDEYQRIELNDPVTPRWIMNLSGYRLLEEGYLSAAQGNKPDLSGYGANDIRMELQHLGGRLFQLDVENHTPRAFKEINFVSGSDAYCISMELPPFGFKTFHFQENSYYRTMGKDAVFLDPSPSFRSSPSSFDPSGNFSKDDLYAYHLFLSHLKAMYALKNTRKDFFDYFQNTRKESLSSALGKWFNTVTYDTPKLYRVRASGSAGVANFGWLSVNWPMDRFNADRSYSFVYTTFSHENAHTMGYDHNSGLAYGWDDFVNRKISAMFGDKSLIPGKIVKETGEVLWHFDPASDAFIPYSHNPSVIEKVTVISHNRELNIDSAYVSNNKVLVKFGSILSSGTILLEAESNASEFLSACIADRTSTFPEVDKDAIRLNTWSPDYAAGVSGNLYYYVSPQEGIVSTSFRERLWNGSHGSTRIVALAKNLNTGQSHPVGIIGNKGGQLLEDGHGALGNVFFELGKYGNDGYYASLPGGIYEVKFKLTAASWHDSSYRREIPVHLVFQLGEIHHLRQGQWSRNFSLETPSGGSSVYFYTPPQDGVATTGLSAPHRSIWNGGSGVTPLTATVFDAANNPHAVALKGYKAFYNRRIRMGDGVQRGFGQLLIEVDRGSASYQALPAGDYRGKMTVVGAGWHDGVLFPIQVDLGFTKEPVKPVRNPMEDFLRHTFFLRW